MKLFYTGAKLFNGAQTLPVKSIGGYLSSSAIPNGSLNNLFSEITPFGISKGLSETIGIILLNDDTVAVNDLLLHFTYPADAITKISINPVAPAVNSKGEVTMEKINDINSLPYVGTFYEADGVGNALNVGSIAAGGYLGLWLKREYLTAAADTYTNSNLITNFNDGVILPKKENIALVMNW